MLSIFATREEAQAWGRERGQAPPRRPLADATLRRIARGVVKYVLDNPRPFLVHMTHQGDRVGRSLEEPLATITGAHRGEQALVAPFMVPRYGEREGQEPRTRSLLHPSPVVVPTGNGGSLVAGFLAKHYGGVVGSPLSEPKGTVTTIDHDSLVAASLAKLRGTSATASPGAPLHTISAGGTHHALVAAFLQKYYGQGIGSGLEDPAGTIPTKDRMGLVTVQVEGQPYVLVDIAMRMLQPRELYRAQGFPDTYRIERGADGRRLSKTEQVRMVGNSVSPPQAGALVRANCAELVARDDARHGLVA
jgi:DNA (cytosine-5)-methyltransferase 1